MILDTLSNWILDPRVRGIDLDSTDISRTHLEILKTKPLLRGLFQRFYSDCRAADSNHFGTTPGLRVEIGSGSSFMRDVYPDVITSDIKILPQVDLVFRAEAMPFPDSSVRSIYGINVFHHLPEPRHFFSEINRVVHPGGGVILIEPHYGPVARTIFPHLHKSEGYDTQAASWENYRIVGPGNHANQALSYLVFKRDIATFEAEFPELRVVLDHPHTHLWYLLSGGVNFRQLVPDSFLSLLSAAERTLTPLDYWLALQHTIVIRKTEA